MAGFVKLNRDLLDWAWADDIVTFGVYAKFLLLAAWKDTEYHGVKLERGELLTNQSEIAQQSGLSRQQVRTVLDRLKATNKITIKREGKNSIVKVIDYACETDGNHIDNRTSTTCQPDCNQTSLLSKEDKEVKENVLIIPENITEILKMQNEIKQSVKAVTQINYNDRAMSFNFRADLGFQENSEEIQNQNYSYQVKYSNGTYRIIFKFKTCSVTNKFT